MRVLLLNPPGKEKYLRDQYCGGTTTKGNYYWHPLDILVQSGIVAKEHTIRVLDANVCGYSEKKTLRLIKEFNPQAIIAVSSVISLKEDLAFFRICKEKFGCRIIISGDIFLFSPKEMMAYPFLDAILLDYNSKDILFYLSGDFGRIKSMVYRNKNRIICSKRADEKSYAHPTPRHELFPLRRYHMPFLRYFPFVSISASHGCPFFCSFCSLGSIGYKERNLKNLFDELDYIHRLGIKEVMFRDPTFSANPRRAKCICREMIKRGYGFSWFCNTRIDKVDDELLGLMKKSGCHTILFGVETGSNRIMNNRMKSISKKQIISIFKKCRSIGIQTLAHFIIGFPDETRTTIRETTNFILKLDSDYLSLNMYIPRYGSRLSSKVFLNKVIPELCGFFDSTKAKKSYCALPIGAILRYRRTTLLRFYLNPSRIFRLFSNISTVTQLKEMFRNGITVFFK